MAKLLSTLGQFPGMQLLGGHPCSLQGSPQNSLVPQIELWSVVSVNRHLPKESSEGTTGSASDSL